LALGQQNQQTDDDCRCLPDIAEEIQHLDIGDQAERCGHEIVDRACNSIPPL
jgi:hypothetical protein